MRIVSQDRTTDLPYESIGVSINAQSHNVIVAHALVAEDGFWVMGCYSSEIRARKVMDLLWDEWRNAAIMFEFPKDDEVEV